MNRRPLLVLQRWRYRRGATLVVFLLSLLVIAAAAIGPCYERAVEQASVRTAIDNASVADTGVSVALDATTATSTAAAAGAGAKYFDAPIRHSEEGVVIQPGHIPYETTLASRDDECQHLTMVAGVCPTSGAQVVASASAARAVGLRVGQKYELSVPYAPTIIDVTIVGLYQPIDASQPYWFGRAYLSSTTGISGGKDPKLDALFAPPAFAAAAAVDLTRTKAELTPIASRLPDLPLISADVLLHRDQIDVDALPALHDTVNRFERLGPAGTLTATSLLPTILDDLDAGFRQARTVERVGSIQLLVLALVAFAVVVSGAAAQRGRELAIARLRGRSGLSAARGFLVEVAVVVLLAAAPAIAVAWGLTAAANALWFGGHAVEIPLAMIGYALFALVAALITLVVIAWRSSRVSINEQLRDVPPAGSRRGIGVLEVALGTAAAGGLLLASTGSDAGGLALLTPMLLAAFGGLFVGRLVVALARQVAGVSWRRRRVSLGLAAASLARRRGYRLAITVLTLAVGLIVFAGQQGAVAAQNRAARALAENGAAVVLDVSTPNVVSLLAVLRSGDPSGRYATAVVEPSSVNGEPLIAVDARSFVHVASWGWPGQRPPSAVLDAFAPRPVAQPITVRGTSLTLHLDDVRTAVVGDASTLPGRTGRGPVFLELTFRKLTGGIASATFGPLPASATRLDLTASGLDCARGCLLHGLQITRDTLDLTQVQLTADIEGLTTDAGPSLISLGRSNQWGSTTRKDVLSGAEGTTRMQFADHGATLGLDAVDADGVASGQYLDLPVAAPVLATKPLPVDHDATDADPLGYRTEAGLDGTPLRIQPVGQIDFIPRLGTTGILVDLATAAANNVQLLAASQVWLADDDPQREARFRSVLAAHHVVVTGRDTASGRRSAYGESAPARGADLTIGVAGLAGLIGVAVLLLTAAASWRGRDRDNRGLLLVGVRRRTVRRATLLELVAAALISVLLGAAVGVLGARITLGSLPMFAGDPSVPIPQYVFVDWPWFGILAGVAAVLFTFVAVLIARRIAAAGTRRET